MELAKIKECLEKHLKWLKREDGGERAELRGADLRGAELRGANLYGANLCGANLRGAELRGANLYGAELSGANLYGADLRGANLYGAELSGADLRGANLYGTELRGANLYGANLCGADLRGAELRGANLYGAVLYGTELYGADLRGANLYGAELRGANLYGAVLYGTELSGVPIEIINKICPVTCPESGSFIGWKKASGGYIVKLQITEPAKRSSATGRKCRCSEAVVLAIENEDGTPADVTTVESGYDANFKYTVGETVYVDNFDDNRMNECAPGIHFFITRQEAVDY